MKLDITKSKNPNIIGEVLRDLSFVEETGCYSCFDLVEGFEEVSKEDLLFLQAVYTLNEINPLEEDLDQDEYDYLNDFSLPASSVYYCKEHDLLVAWYWDGDGTLMFHTPNVTVMNTDCKKDYTWDFTKFVEVS